MGMIDATNEVEILISKGCATLGTISDGDKAGCGCKFEIGSVAGTKSDGDCKGWEIGEVVAILGETGCEIEMTAVGTFFGGGKPGGTDGAYRKFDVADEGTEGFANAI